MAQVEVRVIEKESWHKKGGKESFKRPITIEALFRKGKYSIDLSEEELTTYGQKLGVNLDPTFRVDKPHEFYCSAQGRVKLENNTMIFDTNNVLDAIKVGIMKGSPFIANSLKEYEEGLFGEATHYIFSEEEEIAVKAKKVEINNSCIVCAAKMSLEEKINIAICLGDKPLKGRSQNFIDVAIDDIIKEKPVEFLTYAKKDKKENHIKATVLDALRMNVLTKEGPTICYMGDVIGYGIEEAVSWFKDPNNQIIKTSILEKLNK